MSAQLFELLFNALNEQGYLRDEAYERVLEYNERVTGWEVRASEYSVCLPDQDTRVDIVLRSKISSSPELYSLVECKRAEPSYIYWVFGAPVYLSEMPCSQYSVLYAAKLGQASRTKSSVSSHDCH